MENADTERFVITEGNRAETALCGVHENALLERRLPFLYMFNLTTAVATPPSS